MMLYFIYSPKQSKYHDIDIYWQANENGYTSILANAGVYTEEDKERIESRSSEYGATFIPITKELLQQAKVQLQEKITEYDERIERENERHISLLKELNEKKSQYIALNDLSHITIKLEEMEQLEIEGDER